MFGVNQLLGKGALACAVSLGLMVPAAFAARVTFSGHVTRVAADNTGRAVVVIEDQFGNPFFLILPSSMHGLQSQLVAEARSSAQEMWKVRYNTSNRTITNLDTDPESGMIILYVR